MNLQDNLITDAGCATLAFALRGGALPALKDLRLQRNLESEPARDAVLAVLRGARRSWLQYGRSAAGLP